MNSIVFVVLLVLVFETNAYPTFQANDDGTISALVDGDEYESLEDMFSPTQYKRFWSPHPSDYNPLRRPVPVPIPRGSKREDVVYHPVPRVITIKQQRSGHNIGDEFLDGSEGYLEGNRQKKQTRATTLIFRLGSWGLRSNKDKGKGPATPSPNPA